MTNMQIFDALYSDYKTIPHCLKWTRLNKNQCWISEEWRGHIYVKSYNTICGISDGARLLVGGYYSPTACQHMHKAARHLNLQHVRCDKEK